MLDNKFRGLIYIKKKKKEYEKIKICKNMGIFCQ